MKAVLIDISKISEFEEVWRFQSLFHKLRVEGRIEDVLIFAEHNHVYTIGKAGDEADLKVNKTFLSQVGVKVFKIDRGGKITYHGPGQIVCYPIFKLDEIGFDVYSYLRSLEEVIIRTLEDYGIKARRINGLTGVWVGEEKIASIGIKVSHWVTMHGFALNVNTDLRYFDFIFPCGLKNVEMTSMKKILGFDVSINEVKEKLKEKFKDVFGLEFLVKAVSLKEGLNFLK